MNTKLLLASVCIVFLLPISTLYAQRIKIESGNIVMDASGMKRATTAGKWRSTTAGNGSGVSSGNPIEDIATPESNARVYYKLQIDKEDRGSFSWKDAIVICSSIGKNWRAPTQKEMMLMAILKDDIEYATIKEATTTPIDKNEYWTATNQMDTPTLHWAWMVDTGTRIATGNRNKAETRYVRCVKEL